MWETRWGRLVISYLETGQPQLLEFDRIRGGEVRADEIARSIERQVALLQDKKPNPAATSDDRLPEGAE